MSGHHSPRYLPNMLSLLADMGVRGGDDDRIERALDDLCGHEDADGRFLAFGRAPNQPGLIWGVLDALGRYPHLWRDEADPVRRSLAEMVACLVAYNVSADGTVTPKSVYRGFDRYSFGQKKQPSPLATALLASVVHRFCDLVDDISQIDVLSVAGSKAGSGTPVPPRT